MKTIIKHVLSLSLLAGVYLVGCEQRIVPPVDTGQQSRLGDTNYVEVMPPWGGFQSPRSVMFGNDGLLYVTDYDANEVLMLDAGGNVEGRRTIPHPIALAQNTRLDLYVSGEAVTNDGNTIGALYKINLYEWDTTYVAGLDTVIDTLRNDTTVVPILRDTTLFFNHGMDAAHMRIVTDESGHQARRYPGIAILPGNGYLLARSGPDNGSFVDPDTRVLKFTSDDLPGSPPFVTDLLTLPSGGTAIKDIRFLTGLMVFPSTNNFIVTQSINGVAYGAIYMVFQSGTNFEGWVPKYDPAIPEQHVDFIRAYQFSEASGATFDKSRNEFFVVDAAKDSVFKFDRAGKQKPESFGKHRSASPEFPGLNNPHGIAFATDCTLYIADTGNKVIRRFKITTQTRCSR
jgi:hypothetical protein